MKKYFFQALVGVLGLIFWVYAFQPTPDSVSASPPLGLTPTVTSGPTSTPPPGPTSTPSDDDDDDDSSHSLTVTLECANNLTCPIGPQTIDVAIPVQLIHIGSGWIVDTMISNTGVTQLQVPYGGEWQVFMVGEPQASAPVVVNTSAPPVLLGTIQADSGTQFVACPVSAVCPTIPPTVETPEPPDDFPTSGGALSMPLILILSMIVLFVLLLSGFSSSRRFR